MYVASASRYRHDDRFLGAGGGRDVPRGVPYLIGSELLGLFTVRQDRSRLVSARLVAVTVLLVRMGHWSSHLKTSSVERKRGRKPDGRRFAC